MTDEAGRDSVTAGDINFGTRQLLREPLTTAFGEMKEERRYLSGCTLSYAFGQGREEMVRIVLEDDGIEKIVDVGRTPKQFNPAGMTAQTVVDPGEYLVVIHTPGTKLSIRYLDQAEIKTDTTSVKIEIEKPVTFNPNPQRRVEALTLPGTVRSVTGYKVNPTPIV